MQDEIIANKTTKNLKELSLKELKQLIKEGEEDIKNGRVYPLEDVIKQLQEEFGF